MNTTSRISSIIHATQLETSLTGIPTFSLSELQITTLPEVQLPTNRRLGHLVEKVVSELIKASENYNMLYENVQIIQHKNTIGELDFIIQQKATTKIIHLELAYKFYLFDPTFSANASKNWIGPNRKDALHEKLEKLQQKQFPLLYHEATKAKLPTINVQKITQKLCVLANLFVPYQATLKLNSTFQKAIKGVYMNFEIFTRLDNSAKAYYIPPKKAWGIDPSEHEVWTDFKGVKASILENLSAKRSLLCWQKHNATFETFFIVWW
ncbi:DUF1853 family protein [Kordia sp. SMS9]|uniref:DUF1853 family protein n=1 Tax=Kordia sp. SMS9 TaxID=2282170 RepID=UPI000E0D6029|nr:DUF1853 family protein [Kordia sp. SMS9]